MPTANDLEQTSARLRAQRAAAADLEQTSASLRGAATGGELRPPPGVSSDKASREQVDAAWIPHLGRLIQGSSDPTSMPGPPDVEGILGRQAEEETQLSGLVGGDEKALADLKQKMLARDITTFGGMFFGGPAIGEGVGIAGAVAGAAGRIGAGASIGAGLGLAEGMIGGYDPEELPALARDYAIGGAAMGGLIEGVVGVAKFGSYLKDRGWLKRLVQAIDSKVRSTKEMHEAIRRDPAVAASFEDIAKAESAALTGKAEVKAISKEVSGRASTIRVRDIKRNPGLQDYLFNQLKADHPDLSPNADPAVLWNLGKKKGILPLASRTRGTKAPAVAGDAAESARAAYSATLGEPDVANSFYSRGKRLAATKAARTAAYHAKNQELQELLKVGSLREAAYDGSLSIDLAKSHKYAQNMVLKRVATLVQSPQFFGDAGPGFGKLLHEYLVLKEGVEGHYLRIMQDIVDVLSPADKLAFNKYIRWEGPATNTKVLGAARKWLSFRRSIASEVKELGLEAKDRGLTEVFRKLKPEGKGAILKLQKLAAEADSPEALAAQAKLEKALSPEAADLWANLKRLNGRVEDNNGLNVIRPFQESSIKAPDYIKPEILEAMRENPNHPIIKSMRQQILNERPELKHPSTGEPYEDALMNEVWERLGIGGTGSPDYIWNNSLQWSREAMIPPEFRIEDPDIWAMRYTHSAATRLAAARVFGAREEKWLQLFEQAKRQTGTRLAGPEFKAAGYGTPKGEKLQLAPNLQVMADVYNMAMGRGKAAPRFVRQISDATLRQRIGPSTMVKQFSSLKNVAAAHGVANTLEGIYQVLRSPKARQAGDDFGATVADLVRVLADESLAINPSNPALAKGVSLLWGKSAADQIRRTGTLLTDRFSRRTAAWAAGMKALQAARAVRGLSSPSRAVRIEAEQARRWLEAMDLDVDSILKNGLTQAQHRQAMLGGARSTQFTSTVEDIGGFFTVEPTYGRLAGLLNKFTMQQGPFMLKHVLQEGIKGNLKPVISFLVFMGLGDRGITEVLKQMSNQNYDVATDMLIDSMFGKFGSVAADAAEDRQRTVGNVVLGPAVSLGGDVLGFGSESVKAVGSLASNVPGAPDWFTPPGEALTHTGKALWHLSPATLRQILYMTQAMTGTKE